MIKFYSKTSKISFFLIFLLFFQLKTFPLSEVDSLAFSKLITSIGTAKEPVVTGQYIIFTASGNSRFTGISFEHEQYSKIWPFQRITKKDEKGEFLKDSSGKLLGNTLFYITKYPAKTNKIRYRIVVDGLWKTDPLNPNIEYDYNNGIMVSVLNVMPYEIFETKVKLDNSILFSFDYKTGQKVFIAGSFNNWDPFMYEMDETNEGLYELNMFLPKGTWYYAYFIGTDQFPDFNNQEKVYTKDGRVASVITVY